MLSVLYSAVTDLCCSECSIVVIEQKTTKKSRKFILVLCAYELYRRVTI